MSFPVHLLTALVDEVVVGVSGVLRPLGGVGAAVVVSGQLGSTSVQITFKISEIQVVHLLDGEHEVVGEVRL